MLLLPAHHKVQVYCTISCLFNQNYCLKYIVKQSNFKTKHRSQIERIPSSTRCSKVFLQHRAHNWRTEKKLAMGSLLISKRCCKFLEAARALLMRWDWGTWRRKEGKSPALPQQFNHFLHTHYCNKLGSDSQPAQNRLQPPLATGRFPWMGI